MKLKLKPASEVATITNAAILKYEQELWERVLQRIEEASTQRKFTTLLGIGEVLSSEMITELRNNGYTVNANTISWKYPTNNKENER